MKIRSYKRVREDREIELPYYYKQDLEHCAIFGKIEEGKTTSVDIPYFSRDKKEYSIEIDYRKPDGSYCTEEYESNEEDWLAAVSKFKKFVAETI